MRKPGSGQAQSAPTLIDQRIAELGDWRGRTLSRMRKLIRGAVPDVVEEWKWGIPVWSQHGIICTGETYKQVVKLTFARGASLKDPKRLFNSSLEGTVRRAIDIREGEKVAEAAFKALVRQAAALNGAGRAQRSKKAPTKTDARKRGQAKPKLLSGGNPQIARGEGDAPVQAYIAAVPGWKRDVARRLDAVIVRTVPGVRKAVKWNSPFYGVEDQGWFLSFHCFTKYVKVTFFRGTSLRPVPPGESRMKETRYLDIHEGDAIDEAQLASWVKQASELPGEKM